MEKDPGKERPSAGQMVWGFLLVLMGTAVFIRIPQVASRFGEMAGGSGMPVFARLCLYLVGAVLLGGGLRKIILHGRLLAGAAKADSKEDGSR